MLNCVMPRDSRMRIMLEERTDLMSSGKLVEPTVMKTFLPIVSRESGQPNCRQRVKGSLRDMFGVRFAVRKPR